MTLDLSPATFLLGVLIGTLVSLWMFSRATHHGSSHATAWGICAFFAPVPVVLVYYIRHWIRDRRSPGA